MIGKNMMDLSLLRWYMDFLVKLIDDLNMKAYFIEEGKFKIIPLRELHSFRGNLIINPKSEWLS